jgi:hypothetical protein
LLGTYEPTAELCNELPVYRNKDSPDFWLECCQLGTQWKWYVKATEYRGDNSLSSYGYVNCTANPHEVTLPQDALDGQWSISTGAGFELQPAVTCITLPEPKLGALLAAKREQIAEELQRPPILGSFRIRGATGPRAYLVNGVYEPTNDTCNGQPVYRCKDSPDYWLEYTTFNARNKWYVKSTQYRGATSSTSYAYCEMQGGSALSYSRARSWTVSTGGGFEAQPAVVCERI